MVVTASTSAGGPMPFFEIYRGGRKLGDVDVTGPECLIGRGDEADVRVDETGVSREHARVVAEDGAWSLEDLQTRNGTWVNGQREYRCRLRDGDRIQLGSHVLTFRVVVGERAPATPPKFQSRRRLQPARTGRAADERDAGEGATRIVRTETELILPKSGGDATRVVDTRELARHRREARARQGAHLEPETPGAPVVPLDKPVLRLGLGPKCDVRLALRRARVVASIERRDGGGFELVRRGLFDPLKVNGRRTRATLLEDGDRIELRGGTFVFRSGVGRG